MISRKNYLQQLINFKDSEFIKAITGVRRSGKSSLLLQYKEYLEKEGVKPENIIYINFEDYEWRKLQNDEALYDYLKQRLDKKTQSYLLFDEIQMVENWQKLINSLRVAFKVDLTITGSNAQMLSGELATYLSGRYVKFDIFPFSFKEYLSAKFGDHPDFRILPSAFEDYVKYGGFPAVVMSDEMNKKTILSGIYDTVLLNDVASRGSIRDISALKRVTSFLADNITQIVSTKNIANTINSAHLKITEPTVSAYLSLLENAFLFYSAQRYDLRGKAYLSRGNKYFFVDSGLRHAVLNKEDNAGHELENIVYIELLRRGYSVDVGKLDDKEIDFIARRMNETLYIQVALRLPENTHETDNLLLIKDNYKKIVIIQFFENQAEIDGIPIVNVIDWLMEKEPAET